MLTLPSLRRLILPALCCFSLVALFRFCYDYNNVIKDDTLLDTILQLNLQETHEIQYENSPADLEEQFVELFHSWKPTANPHIKRLFASCPAGQPNNLTFHLQLSNNIYNISMLPRTAEEHRVSNKQYFNPAILPLSPSSAKSPPYLLVARLVTEGLHQESHICFADVCLPSSSGSSARSADTRLCTPSDLEVLGASGGMRCTSEPVTVNIPPTPAKSCSGAWSTFPDIPGFHDPRVFWSGRGEPLIMVNSGSAYGCVGLWVQDLRTLFPPLAELLAKDDLERNTARIMTYPRLTEITRNPRISRSEVEKNWIMFFPKRDESMIMYDLMAKVVTTNEHMSSSHELNVSLSITNNDSFEESALHDGGLAKDMVNESSDILTNNTSSLQPKRQGNESAAHIASPERRSQQRTTGTDRAETKESQVVVGGRTMALLSSDGYATHNLTHPAEPPCFDLLSTEHTHDRLNNTGHWHQGSNSLRLVLCNRAQLRNKTCLPSQTPIAGHDDEGDNRQNPPLEDLLVAEGLVVHFSIVHRKFSNNLDLPLRYERYLVVWEARRPWRMVGVSRWPLLFAQERARPWTKEENWQHQSKKDATVRKSMAFDGIDTSSSENDGQSQVPGDGWVGFAYFTYSPSIAWAWRARSDINPQDASGNRRNEGLGTGYMGDEVLIGIGIDDVRQGFAKVKVETLLQCLRLCPGVDADHEDGD